MTDMKPPRRTIKEQLEDRKRERASAVSMLRIECAELGDNDWPDNLHLADIIEKHLADPATARIAALEQEVVALLDELDDHDPRPGAGVDLHHFMQHHPLLRALDQQRRR